MNISKLHQAGSVRRWHTCLTLKDQDLAAHSWGVALVIMAIRPEMDSPNLLKAALVHDLHEFVAGDIPYPFKKNNPQVKKAYDKQEADFNVVNEIQFDLDPYDTRCLKWADMFELYLFAERELSMGNQNMVETMRVAIRALLALGAPNELARALFFKTTGVMDEGR